MCAVQRLIAGGDEFPHLLEAVRNAAEVGVELVPADGISEEEEEEEEVMRGQR